MPPQPSNTLPLRDRRLWLPLLLLILLAAALRLLPLAHEALNGDEMFSRRIVVEPLATSWYDIREDLVHPPLYYLVLKSTTYLWGAGPLGLRLVSLVAGLLTLPVLVLLGNRLPGARWSGLLAAACVAVGRFDLFYSQEARSYALYTLFVLLLVLWLAHLRDSPHSLAFWALGCGLMTVLVYTHYVGGVFVALAILAVLLSSVPVATRLRTLACGVVALLLFLPWLLGEIGVLHAKHGIGQNLDWQGHPAFYDLRQVWAIALGVGNFPGATLLALLLLLVFSGAALVLLARQGILRRTPLVLALALMGWLTPLLVFVLSEPPVNLPLFALRHVLPATVLLTLLCAFGLELLSRLLVHGRRAVFALGSLCLLLLAGVPTLQALHGGATRIPYDRVEALVLHDKQAGLPAYAVWFYGIGEPVNFYCHTACVHDLPASDTALPANLLLLYRPASKSEALVYKRLLGEGYVDLAHTYFTDGLGTPFGTSAATLARPAPPPPTSSAHP